MYLCTGLFLTGCMTSGSNARLLLCLGSCKLYLYKSGIISVSDAGFCPDFLTGGWQKIAHAHKWFPEGSCSGSDSFEKTCGAPGFSFPWRLFETIYWDKAEPYLPGDKSRCSTTIQLQCISIITMTAVTFSLLLGYFNKEHMLYSRHTIKTDHGTRTWKSNFIKCKNTQGSQRDTTKPTWSSF